MVDNHQQFISCATGHSDGKIIFKSVNPPPTSHKSSGRGKFYIHPSKFGPVILIHFHIGIVILVWLFEYFEYPTHSQSLFVALLVGLKKLPNLAE